MKITIVGGGIGGLSCALSLHAAGFDDVDVFCTDDAVSIVLSAKGPVQAPGVAPNQETAPWS